MISKMAIMFAISTILLVASSAHGLEVLADNLDKTFTGHTNVNNTQWPSQRFTTTESAFTISEIRILLNNGTSATGNFDVEIWDDSGTSGRPGVQVGSTIHTGLAQNLGTTTSSFYTISGLNVSLERSKNYYLVVQGTSLSASLRWRVTSSASGGVGFPSPAYTYVVSTSTWSGPRRRISACVSSLCQNLPPGFCPC
jgi:hypothetical protein